MQSGSALEKSQLGSLSHKGMDKMIFQSPFQPGLFCNSMILKERVCPLHCYPVPHVQPHSTHAGTETFIIKMLRKKPGLGRDSLFF